MPKTDDGLQIHMGINFFGHYLLTRMLLPLLKSTVSDYKTKPRLEKA